MSIRNSVYVDAYEFECTESMDTATRKTLVHQWLNNLVSGLVKEHTFMIIHLFLKRDFKKPTLPAEYSKELFPELEEQLADVYRYIRIGEFNNRLLLKAVSKYPDSYLCRRVQVELKI